MSYINVGAYSHGQRLTTKKALKLAVSVEPGSVTFDVTSELGPRGGDTIRATVEDIGTRHILAVTGPDPYTARNWYASVQVMRGQVKVS